MSKTELKTTNKKVLDFYNANSMFNFDDKKSLNILLVILLII